MRKVVAAGAKPFDATTKELVESGPADWVRLLGLPADQAKVIDADLATISTEADRVILVTAPYSYLVHLEFQSGHDGADVPERLLRYNVLLSYRHRLPVRSASFCSVVRRTARLLAGN